MNYNSFTSISGPAFQIVVFTETAGSYDIEYICESVAGTELTDFAWRISRIRYLTGTTTLVDKYFAVNELTEYSTGNTKRFDYGKGTAEFIFPLINESMVKGYTYGASV